MPERDRAELERRIIELAAAIDDAYRRLPRHSVRPHQLREIEEMEEELAGLRGESERAGPAG